MARARAGRTQITRAALARALRVLGRDLACRQSLTPHRHDLDLLAYLLDERPTTAKGRFELVRRKERLMGLLAAPDLGHPYRVGLCGRGVHDIEFAIGDGLQRCRRVQEQVDQRVTLAGACYDLGV